MTPDISIVIVNWNSKEYLRRCLQTIEETKGDLALQIIVVDGASYDGCGEMLTAEFPAVDFIQATENIGFGRCNNLGVAKATGERLLLLNPDCEVRPGAIQALVKELDRRDDVGVIGARLLNTDGTLQTSCVQALPTPFNQAIDSDLLRRLFPNWRVWGTAEAFRAKEAIEVEAVSGACMMLRTARFRAVGGFSPEYFMYAEDMDLCAKLRLRSQKVYHLPSATIIHHGGGSSGRAPSDFAIQEIRNAVCIFIHKSQGNAASRRYKRLQALSATIRGLMLVPIAISTTKKSATRLQLQSARAKWRFVRRWATSSKSAVRSQRTESGPPGTHGSLPSIQQ